MPKVHGIYLDILFNQKYVVIEVVENNVKAVWLSSDGILDPINSQFPTTAMNNDIYCGQASELMVALL
jgi:hypothetical protein